MRELMNEEAEMTDKTKIEFTAHVTMLSDWHVGAGVGRPGNIDSLILRDADGFPFVPAKTLTGIWRDAMERLTYALDNGIERTVAHAKGKLYWADWVAVIFGSQPALARPDDLQTEPPRPAALSVMPARLSKTLRDKINQTKDSRLLSALTFVKPGVAIDEVSGTAKTDFLRFEEMARIDAELVADCVLDMNGWNGGQVKAAKALLAASARIFERLGGKRRRGAGRCELKLAGYKADEINWLTTNKDTLPPLPAFSREVTISPTSIAQQAANQSTADWQRVEIELELETPVAIAARTLGNVTETLDFVPGSYLLPHITKILSSEVANVRAAVAAGEIQVLTATPEISGTRGWPVPAVLAHKKVGGGFEKQRTIINRLKEAPDDLKELPSDSSPQMKNYRVGYVGTETDLKTTTGADKLPGYQKTPTTLLTHNTVEDRVQRPTENVGGVYSREAIAPAVKLRSELRWYKTVSLSGPLLQSLHGRVRLGASRKDDYGAAQLSVVGKPKDLEAAFAAQETADNKERLTVWLLSDVLLRDERLRQTTLIETLREALEAQLNEGPPSQAITLKEAETRKDYLSSLLDTRRIDSWHEGWGLPRPSLIAIKAGSVTVFEVTSGTLDEECLKMVQRAGIGERRGEGYGQLCFNHPLLTNPLRDWPPSNTYAGKSVNASGDSNSTENNSAELSEKEKNYAKVVERAAWRTELQSAVLKGTATRKLRQQILSLQVNGRGQSEPPLSQLGGLRSVVQQLRNDDVEMVTNWLKHLEDTPNRFDKWPRGALRADPQHGNQLGIVNKLFAGGYVWTLLKDLKDTNGQAVWQDPATIEQSAEDLRNDLWAEAVRSLVDACLRAHKRALKNPKKDKAKKEAQANGAAH